MPNGFLYLDPIVFKTRPVWETMDLKNVTKIDFRWGFQNEALMTVTRIGYPSPRTGFLGLFDGPTFDKSKLTAIPDTVGEFSVVSLDMKTLLDKIIPLAKSLKPGSEAQITKFVDSVKTTTKLRLKEDILAHLGPKVTFFSLPTKSGSKAAIPTAGVASMVLGAFKSDQVPRSAIVFDIDDPVAFGKVLDQLMVGVNRELKAMAAKTAGVDAAPVKGSRGRGPNVPSLEFRLMPGESKSYMLSVPPELASQYPATFRPAIRVGGKQAVIAVTSEVARLVLENKEASTGTADATQALKEFSTNLTALSLNDPRETLPSVLASFPGTLQAAINTAIQLRSGAMGASNVAGATTPTGPNAAIPGNRRSDSGGRRKPIGVDSPGSADPAPAAPGGATGAASSASPANLVLKIDAAKLPSAEAIKALLFPSVLAVEAENDEIRIVSRVAFPSIPDPSKLSAIAGLTASWMGMKGAAPLPSMMPGMAGPKGGAASGPVPNAVAPRGAGAAGGNQAN
jgi:hypothetical protein